MDDLDKLKDKLAAFEASKTPKAAIESADARNLNVGIRAGTELVVSIVICAAIGFGLDRWLGTKPWLMIAFLFLGLAAGFMSVYRITNNLGSAVGFAALQKDAKDDTKPAEIPETDDE